MSVVQGNFVSFLYVLNILLSHGEESKDQISLFRITALFILFVFSLAPMGLLSHTCFLTYMFTIYLMAKKRT